jgi:DNA-binding transcriptional MerR regulator
VTEVRIGELAAITDTTTKTLRFYGDAGLLRPEGRTATGYRQYGQDATVAKLHDAARGGDPDTCGTEQICRYL